MRPEQQHDPGAPDLAPPEQWEVRIADVTAPLTATIARLAFDLAKAQGEARAWQEHAERLRRRLRAAEAKDTDADATRVRSIAGRPAEGGA